MIYLEKVLAERDAALAERDDLEASWRIERASSEVAFRTLLAERDDLAAKLREVAERAQAAAQASVPPDRVAPESYAMGFRAGLECAAQAEPENPTPPGGLAMLSYSIGFAKGIDVMRNAIRALSAPAQGEK